VSGYRELDVQLADGSTIHAYDTAGDGFPVVWHHGTPNLGIPPVPLFAAAERLGLRWLSYDRPGYGGSTPRPDRPVGSAAADVEAVVDALGVERFAVAGHSGGSPHALACAALLDGRVTAAVTMAGMAPYGAEGLDWFAGMCASAVAALTSAAQGRAAKEAHQASGEEYDPEFTPADFATFETPWGKFFERVVGPAMAAGPAAQIDDDLAYTAPWGFAPADVHVPVLVLHGTDDRIIPSQHGEWMGRHLPDAEARILPGEAHISVLRSGDDALEWLSARRR
jgi:pimeloyl-ACP methyl ester carboxylesterase